MQNHIYRLVILLLIPCLTTEPVTVRTSPLSLLDNDQAILAPNQLFRHPLSDRARVKGFQAAVAGQIGNFSKVIQVDPASATVEDLVENENVIIKLTPQFLLTSRQGKGVLAQVLKLGVEYSYRPLIFAMITATHYLPAKWVPKVKTFSSLINDLFGFAWFSKFDDSRRLLTIGLHESLLSYPIVMFHESMEYLIKANILILTYEQGLITVRRYDKRVLGSVEINDPEALQLIEKGPTSPHYLLRALQRQIFGKHDRELEELIESMQSPGELVELQDLPAVAVDAILHSIFQNKQETVGIIDLETQTMDDYLIQKDAHLAANQNLLKAVGYPTGSHTVASVLAWSNHTRIARLGIHGEAQNKIIPFENMIVLHTDVYYFALWLIPDGLVKVSRYRFEVNHKPAQRDTTYKISDILTINRDTGAVRISNYKTLPPYGNFSIEFTHVRNKIMMNITVGPDKNASGLIVRWEKSLESEHAKQIMDRARQLSRTAA